jgi:hypothetical protein
LDHGAAHAQHQASRADTVVGSPTAKALVADVAAAEDVVVVVWNVVVAVVAEVELVVDLRQAQLPVAARLRLE